MNSRIIPGRKTIALVAHDSCKSKLIQWAINNKSSLEQIDLVATGTTGKLLQDSLKLPVKSMLSGPYGGDQQLGSSIAEGGIHMMIFFWDPLEQQAHDNDVKALQRIAALWNIPFACNVSSADFMITSSLMNSDYKAEIPEQK